MDRTSRAAAWAGTVVVLVLAPLGVGAFKEGPLPGHTGGFGEPTCQSCHLDHAVNTPGGAVRVSGLPESYTAGGRYAMRVTLARPGLRRGGFQLAVRFAEGPRAGEDAGTLERADDRVQIVAAPHGRVHYAQHTRAGGTPTGEGETEWAVRWTAPAARERWPVAVHVAANAANDDDSPLGDYIYLAEARSRPE